jgi:hypothetical protein
MGGGGQGGGWRVAGRGRRMNASARCVEQGDVIGSRKQDLGKPGGVGWTLDENCSVGWGEAVDLCGSGVGQAGVFFDVTLAELGEAAEVREDEGRLQS